MCEKVSVDIANSQSIMPQIMGLMGSLLVKKINHPSPGYRIRKSTGFVRIPSRSWG